MSHQRTTIRYGQILERITGKALNQAGYNFQPNPEYDSVAVIPDFIMPTLDEPERFIEVTQTEDRGSFRMKILRYFELVASAKVHFGSYVSSVTFLYGLPDQTLPESNLRASLGFFDAAFLPRIDNILSQTEINSIAELEKEAWELAEGQESGEKIANDLEISHASAIGALTRYFSQRMPQVTTNLTLSRMWDLERERVRRITISQNIQPIQTYYKKGILQALFLTDLQFQELLNQCKDPETNQINLHPEFLSLSENILGKLIELGLASNVPTTSGNEIHLDQPLKSVLSSHESMYMTQLARRALEDNEKMAYFFRDIHNGQIRQEMAVQYLDICQKGEASLAEAIYLCLTTGEFMSIRHARCWLADFIPLQINKTQNYLNNTIAQHSRYIGNIANPFNNIVTRSDRLLAENQLENYVQVVVDIWNKETKHINTAEQLSQLLLKARLQSAIKLQNFDPLYVVLEKILTDEDWHPSYPRIPSILGDLTENDAVGRFDMCTAVKNAQKAYINILAANENPTDKSKEWAARGRALHYRLKNGRVEQVDVNTPMVFICDGKWDVKSRRRLERVGWRTCTLDELPRILQELSGDPPTTTLNSTVE